MNNLFKLVLLSVSLSACSKPSAPITTTPVVSVVIPTVSPPVKIVGSNWSLEVPVGFEKIPADKQGLEAMYSNTDKKELISLTKEPFTGSTKDYTLAIAADLQRADMGPSSSNAVKVSDTDAIQIECSKDGIHAWITSFVKGGQAYVFSCGGTSDNSELKDTCSIVLSSLVVK